MKLHAQGSSLDLSHPHVMGILNVTPDSFSDGGTHNTLVDAVKHANLMLTAGATIVDIGRDAAPPCAAGVCVDAAPGGGRMRRQLERFGAVDAERCDKRFGLFVARVGVFFRWLVV